MSNDPWKDRPKGMKCGTCIWHVLKEQRPLELVGPLPIPEDLNLEPGVIYPEGAAERAVITSGPNGRLGRCRKRAPTLNGFPAVFENDWCGDHKLDENKIIDHDRRNTR